MPTELDYPKRKLIMLPGPTNVPDRVTDAMLKPMINHRGETFSKLLKEVTEKAKYLFQTEQDALILTCSGTGGVEASVWNLVGPGDEAVIPVFGEFSERLAEMVELAGGKPIGVRSEFGSTPTFDDVRLEVEKHKNLKALFIVHNETSTGCAIQELEALSRLGHDHGAFVVIDAISSLGGYSVPVDRWGVDICVTGSQKCLAAPPGLALLSLSARAVDHIKKTPPRVRYFDLGRQLEYLSRGETPFTPAVPLYYALDEALEMLQEEGLENRVQRHTRLSGKLYQHIGAMGLKFFAKEDVRSRTVVAAYYPTGIDDRLFRKALSDDHDILIAGGFGNLKGKLFRVGSMGEVTDSHIERTVSGLAITLAKFGYQVDIRGVLGAMPEAVR